MNEWVLVVRMCVCTQSGLDKFQSKGSDRAYSPAAGNIQ